MGHGISLVGYTYTENRETQTRNCWSIQHTVKATNLFRFEVKNQNPKTSHRTSWYFGLTAVFKCFLLLKSTTVPFLNDIYLCKSVKSRCKKDTSCDNFGDEKERTATSQYPWRIDPRTSHSPSQNPEMLSSVCTKQCYISIKSIQPSTIIPNSNKNYLVARLYYLGNINMKRLKDYFFFSNLRLGEWILEQRTQIYRGSTGVTLLNCNF